MMIDMHSQIITLLMPAQWSQSAGSLFDNVADHCPRVLFMYVKNNVYSPLQTEALVRSQWRDMITFGEKIMGLLDEPD